MSRSIVLCRALVLATSVPTLAFAQRTSLSVRAENALDAARVDETVAVPWATVRAALPDAAAGKVRVVDADGAEHLSQVVDNDGNGTMDELIFVADFRPKERKTFTVTAAAPTMKATPRTFVYHDDPRDDVAWESDRIAFRIYGEGLKKTSSAMSSSGIDVWQKSVHKLVVDAWYKKGHDAYHIDTGEGADFYDVGETLGTGGTAIWVGDTIYRADNFKAYKIIANGPVRAVFELRYDPWDARGRKVSEIKRFSIDAGQNLYQQETVFQADGSGPIPYVIGVVKRPGMIGIMNRDRAWGWLTGWGPVVPKNGGHGELGTAIMLPASRIDGWREAHGHYLAVTHAQPGERVVHYIGAGWTSSGDFPTPQSWWTYLNGMSDRLASPIKVTTTP